MFIPGRETLTRQRQEELRNMTDRQLGALVHFFGGRLTDAELWFIHNEAALRLDEARRRKHFRRSASQVLDALYPLLDIYGR